MSYEPTDASWIQGDWANHSYDYEMSEIYAATSVDTITNDVWAAFDKLSPLSSNAQTTTKIPPSYDGSRMWFMYEQEVDEW